MNPIQLENVQRVTRRRLFGSAGLGIGSLALASLVGRDAASAAGRDTAALPGLPHHPPTAKRVVMLWQGGGPSHVDLFDPKPVMRELAGQDIPESVRGSTRLSTMSSGYAKWPVVPAIKSFRRHGRSGLELSEMLPRIGTIADDICLVRSMHTEAVNHAPGVTFFLTGAQVPGRPSMGAWLQYGLGSENSNLPGFVVLITKGKGGQPLGAHLWGNGFLPAEYQGLQFRPAKDPVLYLNNPDGVSVESRRLMLDRFSALHAHALEQTPEPGIQARISNYEMAFRMQSSIPEVTDLSSETEATFDLYGPDSKTPGTFAANCLQARRLAEKGVRFIQLYHQDWDHHGGLPGAIPKLCKETDRGCAALLQDLKQRGMLEETLVVWGGEFGRTNYCQGKLSKNFGRDHHPRCYSIWLAGGGVRGGMVYGETDELGYNVAADGVHVHDLQATILHQMGLDHEALTYKFAGRRYRLTDVHGKVVKAVLA
jgi:hypothetical protein